MSTEAEGFAPDPGAELDLGLPPHEKTDDPRKTLAAAMDRLRRAQDAEPHADADAEAEYASDLVALAARDLVRHVEGSPDRHPVGWGDGRFLVTGRDVKDVLAYPRDTPEYEAAADRLLDVVLPCTCPDDCERDH